MPTESQTNASRTNGAKSHGPTTEEGKQASSRNSLRHGILSKKVVLEGESQAEFDELLTSFLEEHQPETPTERTLVENMVVARWRQERVWNLETAALDHQIRHPKYFEADDHPTQAFIAFRTLTDDSRSLELLNRYEARFERQFRAALTALLNLRAKRAAERAAERNKETRASQSAKPGPGDGSPKAVRLWWVDEDGHATLAADPNAPPENDNLKPAAAVSGSFGSPASPAEKHPCRPIPIDRNRMEKPASPRPDRTARPEHPLPESRQGRPARFR